MLVPYFELNGIEIGPVKIYVWGIMVALGIITSFSILKYKLRNESSAIAKKTADFAFWAIVFGIIFARIFHVVLFSGFLREENFLRIFYIWDGGLSSIGGIFGAVLVLIWFFYKKKITGFQTLDTVSVALPFGWAIGRVGCFLAHLHPGEDCRFCAVKQVFKNSSVGTDLGLYDMILWFVIGALLFIFIHFGFLKEKGKKFVFVFMFYFFVRFFLDFLRIEDKRYFLLTPTQIIIPVFLICLLLIYHKILKTKIASIDLL